MDIKINYSVNTELEEYNGFKKGKLVTQTYGKGIFRVSKIERKFVEGKEVIPIATISKWYSNAGTPVSKSVRNKSFAVRADYIRSFNDFVYGKEQFCNTLQAELAKLKAIQDEDQI